jgi:large subunit ribosomal protein L11
MESIVKISRMKLDISYAYEVRSAAKEIIGSCVSNGVKIEDKPAKEIYPDLSAGKYDQLFS